MNALTEFVKNNTFYLVRCDGEEESEKMTFREAIKERLEKEMNDEVWVWRIEFSPINREERFEIYEHPIWSGDYSDWICDVYEGEIDIDEEYKECKW
jgi:hypothetical protein